MELENSMPKMKSHRGAMKRLRVTGSGKIRRAKAYAGHLMTSKSRKRKRKLRKSTLVSAAEHKRMITLFAGRT